MLREGTLYNPSLYTQIANRFKNWKYRSNYISLDELFDKIGLTSIISKAEDSGINTEEFIFFCEGIFNLSYIVPEKSLGILAKENRSAILKNIANALEQLGYIIKYFESEDFFKLVKKDWKVKEASSIIGSKYDLGEKLYLYRHRSLKNRLYDKADILCRLYKVFETKENMLKANQYATLASDIGFLSDKLDVRHAPSKKEKILLDGFSNDEQEQWYDELFNLFLDMLILCDHIEKRKDVKELKQKYGDIK